MVHEVVAEMRAFDSDGQSQMARGRLKHCFEKGVRNDNAMV